MKHVRVLVGVAGLGLVLATSGCAVFTQPAEKPAPVESAPDYTTVTPPATAPAPPPRPAEPPASAAWQALVNKAGQASGQGDYEQALALLERAQRIDPDSAEIYLQMARTHQARGDVGQARATAERGLLYCVNTTQCDALRAYTR